MADLVTIKIENPKWRMRSFRLILTILPIAYHLRLFPASWLNPTCDALIAWVVRGVRVRDGN